MPSGKGFDSVEYGVKPPSRVETSEVCWLNPVWSMPVPTPATGKKNTPVPARMTVLPPSAAGDHDKPKRGPKFMAGVWNRLRLLEDGKSRPPFTTNCEAGNSDSGLFA